MRHHPDFRAVVSVSLGVNLRTLNTGLYPDMKDVINRTRDKTLYVFSAGNLGENYKFSCNRVPTCLGDQVNAITVAALAPNSPKKLSEFSNYGGRWVQIAAPGSDIVSTDIKVDGEKVRDIYSIRTGTSTAVPFVTAVAAEIWARRPTLTAGVTVGMRIAAHPPRRSGRGR